MFNNLNDEHFCGFLFCLRRKRRKGKKTEENKEEEEASGVIHTSIACTFWGKCTFHKLCPYSISILQWLQSIRNCPSPRPIEMNSNVYHASYELIVSLKICWYVYWLCWTMVSCVVLYHINVENHTYQTDKTKNIFSQKS